MRVLQLRRQMDLPPEALEAQPSRQDRRQDLDHDLPLEINLLGQEDVRHAAAPELPLDAVRIAERALQSLDQAGGVDVPHRRCVWR